MSSNHFHLNTEKGFTLVEVVVVSVLLALLAGILYGTLTGIMNAKNSIEQQRDSLRTARSVLLRVTRELNGIISENLVFSTKNTNKPPEGKPFLGRDGRGGDGDDDSISFVTTSGAQAVMGGISNYGNIQISYRLEEDPDKIYCNPDIEDIETYVLVREESPAGLADEKVLKKRRVIFPIAADITSLNFRYLKNKKWQTQWGEKEKELPDAIEITIKIASRRNVETFRTAIALRK